MWNLFLPSPASMFMFRGEWIGKKRKNELVIIDLCFSATEKEWSREKSKLLEIIAFFTVKGFILVPAEKHFTILLNKKQQQFVTWNFNYSLL